MRVIGSIAIASPIVFAAFFAGSIVAQPEPTSIDVKTDARVLAKVPFSVPSEERGRRNPNPVDAASLKRGAELFASQCAMCHGASGNGRAELAEAFDLDVPNFTELATQQARTDGEWFYILERGHGSMPSHEKLPDDLKWDLVSHLRTLAKR